MGNTRLPYLDEALYLISSHIADSQVDALPLLLRQGFVVNKSCIDL